MGSDIADVVEALPVPSSFKAHRAICGELLKLVNVVSSLLPEIEAARPRCSLGIQTLCLLNRAIEKAKQVIQHCCDSSKLYLVLTADVIITRCEKARTSLEQSLVQIQNMVPVMLALEISHLVDDIKSTTFIMDSSEEEAGRFLRQLLYPGTSESNTAENSELRAFKCATLKLHITSPKAILIEKRSIKKLLDTVLDSDPRKRKILMYLMYLFKKYGELIVEEHAESGSTENEESYTSRHKIVPKQPAKAESRIAGSKESQNNKLSDPIFLEEFKCPLSSRLMYDPVVIASGQTFERMWIQKWFEEGNDTCPKTKMKLPNRSMTPNSTMKEVISRWCERHGVTIPDPEIEQEVPQSWDNSLTSIASFGSSVNLRLHVDLSSVSIESFDTSFNSVSSLHKAAHGLGSMLKQSNDVAFTEHQEYPISKRRSFESLSTLPDLQWETQCEVVENIKYNLDSSGGNLSSASPENFLEPVVRFVSNACQLGDAKAQKTGCQLLLAYLKKSRYGVTSFSEDALSTLVSIFDSEAAEEALAILEILSAKESFQQSITASGVLSSIQKILNSGSRDLQIPTLKILSHLSSNYDICSSIFSSGCITELVPLLKDTKLAKHSLLILRNLCDIEPARISVTKTDGCIASIAELLEIGTNEEQEHAVSILLMLCSQREEYCRMVLDEGFTVIPALVSISINGNEKAKVSAMELLRLVRDVNYVDPQVSSQSGVDEARPRDSGNSSKEAKSSSRSSGFFGKKMSIFSKQK